MMRPASQDVSLGTGSGDSRALIPRRAAQLEPLAPVPQKPQDEAQLGFT
jgi:hypothetical protein